MSRNSEYVTRMEAQLRKWDADVAELAAQGEKAGAEARAAHQEQMKGLRASGEAAQKSFRQIRAASESASTQMHEGLEAAWKTMQKSLQKAAADLRAHAAE